MNTRWRSSMAGLLAALSLATPGCEQPQLRDHNDHEPRPRRHPRLPPEFPPVLAGDADCGRCGRTLLGHCSIERGGYCPSGPVDVSEVCFYDVPCVESCCDRFPLLGSIALVRPGRPLYANAWSEPRVEIARVPNDTRGLLVRVTELPEDTRLVQINTLGHATPDACEGVLDELRGVVLEAAVDPADLRAPPRACTEVAYVLGDPEARNPGINVGDYDYPFDPTPYPDNARVLQAWGFLDHPAEPGESSGPTAGRTVADVVLTDDEPLREEHGELCFHLPGRMRVRVCAAKRWVHVIDL